MEEPQSLWSGGLWEQPDRVYPTPPPVQIPPKRTPSPQRKKGKGPLIGFGVLFSLILLLTLGTAVLGTLLPQEEEEPFSLPDVLSELESGEAFSQLERAEIDATVKLPITQTQGPVLTPVEIYEKCVPSIVSIEVTGLLSSGGGTGIVMTEDGYVLTNAHVVDDAYEVRVIDYQNHVYSARLVVADEEEDVALLKVEGKQMQPAEFGDSDLLRPGDMVVAIGDPLGYRTSITQGIVSAVDRWMEVDGTSMQLIQTSAPINFGNSGGALINDRGQVVGITTLKIVLEEGGAEGLGFAIPIQKVKNMVEWMLAGKPTFGFSVSTQLGAEGLAILEVERTSSAYEAGLQRGDVLTQVNGIPITQIMDLEQVRNTLVVGEDVTLTILRDGEVYSLTFPVNSKDEIEKG